MDMSVIERSGCAVLAGGAGKRMGKLNKAELNLDGQSFLTGICSEFEKAGFRGYVSVANYDQKAPEGWILVKDSVTGPKGEFIGPTGGICSCLKQAEKDGLEGLFFAPCDAPFYSSGLIRVLADEIDRDAGCDAVIVKTPDGKLQTTFGWYSVRCIDAFQEDALSGKYKILKTLEKLRSKFVSSRDAGIDEKCFLNINSVDDYSKIVQDRKEARHILICGKRRVGKSMLINRVLEDTDRPVYGFLTKASAPDENGVRHVYMYPAGNSSTTDDPKERTRDNHIGDTCGKVLSVNTEVFDRLGVSLIHKADRDGILIMDELGFMEENANDFRSAVLAALDSDIPILAAIKDTDKDCSFLEAVKNHPNTELLMIDKENRDELFRHVRDRVRTW